ncbi:uncharacterized aarF domain-containing protein kinase 5 isoform X2 [Cimex lectularius]|uniref:ABC1 atypical kinase-like domain-containing protein n=1 Tax=Cimex lectularius TaxID=79782 RepID=A0A8I6SV01_CIMLE|nr:uncharacterized aarF domain-containing protein kinase 5 isoform X2 [Cimex lectularius]
MTNMLNRHTLGFLKIQRCTYKTRCVEKKRFRVLPRLSPLSLKILAGATAVGCGYYMLKTDKEKRAIKVTFGGITRFFRSSFIATQIAVDYYWTLFRVPEDSESYYKILSEIHKRSAERILNGCLKNGGLYIKLGQGLIIMDHLLPKEYIQGLIPLQDKCLVRNFSEVEQLFKEDFGKDVSELFTEFNKEPIAAASLAQVFKAKLKTGEEVAVKTQYIDLQDRFIGDMMTLKILLAMAAKIYPDFDFGWVLNELKGTLSKELNFLNEAKNAEKCAKDLSHLPFVYIPKVYWDYSSSRVLTTEMIDGEKISNKKGLKKRGLSLADIDRKLFKTFSEQIFYTGFVHADPHSGNILVRKGTEGAQLVILDHGLYEDVPPEISESLRNLWKAMVLNNHPDMKKYAMELGIKEYKIFVEILTQVPQQGLDIKLVQSLTLQDLDHLTKRAQKQFDKIMGVLRKLPSNILLVIRNINTIRSIARDHGDPINRYKEMARCASYGTFEKRSGSGPIAYFQYWKERTDFEFKLWWGGVKNWVFGIMIKILTLGISDGQGAKLNVS